jgi:hypothetical protein
VLIDFDATDTSVAGPERDGFTSAFTSFVDPIGGVDTAAVAASSVEVSPDLASFAFNLFATLSSNGVLV